MPSRGERASAAQVGTPGRTASGSPQVAHTASSNNHDFYLQCAMQTERSIGELKAVVESLTKASDKHASKLEKLNEDVNKAKGALKVIGWVGGVMGAVGLALLAAVLKQLGDYVTKH